MLIAEIHGKRLPEAEGQEDWFTSAVFGHLRHIAPGAFWADLFNRAHTVAPRVSRYSRICEAGIRLDQYSTLDIHFWKCWEKYGGEPDLVLCFSGVNCIRVSLNAGIDNARERIFGLQWQDVLESASANSAGETLLGEVAQFLKFRGLEAFRGFRAPPTALKQVSGSFFEAGYFAAATTGIDPSKLNEGRFYGD